MVSWLVSSKWKKSNYYAKTIGEGLAFNIKNLEKTLKDIEKDIDETIKIPEKLLLIGAFLRLSNPFPESSQTPLTS